LHFKLTLEYDGTNYNGWQLQKHAVTIQGTLEAALSRICNAAIRVQVAGRTDAGVHALGQVASFKTEKLIDCYTLQRALNSLLSPDIAIKQIEEVAENFSPRFDALSRIYRYQIWNHRWPSAIWARYSWHVLYPLNIAAMQQAAALLIGEHDFSSFQGADWIEHNPRRTILRSEVRHDGEFLVYDVEGRSFLRHMVRNIVGTLVGVGRGALSIEEFAAIFAARDRRRAGVNAPPQGLFLVAVTY
jgi:tRNA pseudouridine38-40 synthase